ncbi:MAG: hypothetical protein ACOYWZ_16985 [Bacillota bacterium]
MGDKKEKKEKREERTVAPGLFAERFGEDATREDEKKGNSTKVVRVYLDETDPS